MNRRTGATWALVLVCLAFALPVEAHRLDEYLQAARIAIAHDRVHLELDLTPGVAVAPTVLALLDSDRNGTISAAERETYARNVINALVVTMDGRPVHPRLETATMPAWQDVTEGVGIIRLTASADLPPVASGSHQLFFRNVHESEIGVYLANALVPADDRIAVTGQQRDRLQHELTIDYRVQGSVARASATWPPLLAGVLVALVIGLVSFRLAPR